MSKIKLSSRNLVLGAYLAASFALASSSALALGSTPVTVTNPTDIAKAQGVQHAFGDQAVCKADAIGGTCDATFDLATSFNANQRVVLEFVSAQCTMAPNFPLDAVMVFTTVNGALVAHFLPVLDHFGTGNGAGNHVAVGQVIRDYADPNSTITFRARAMQTGLVDCNFSFTGQAIDQ